MLQFGNLKVEQVATIFPLAVRLQVGDTVTIRYKDYEETLQLIHRPQGAGDLWQFVDEDGAVIAVNPYYSELREMVRKI